MRAHGIRERRWRIVLSDQHLGALANAGGIGLFAIASAIRSMGIEGWLETCPDRLRYSSTELGTWTCDSVNYWRDRDSHVPSGGAIRRPAVSRQADTATMRLAEDEERQFRETCTIGVLGQSPPPLATTGRSPDVLRELVLIWPADGGLSTTCHAK